MNYQTLAKEIVRLLGGQKNVDSVYNCVTRLRFQLQDSSKADLKQLRKTEGVLEAQFQSGELQVVIGPGVEKVSKAIADLIGTDTSAPRAKSKNKISDFLEMIPSIFQPIVPAIAGTGLLKGILAGISIFKLAPANSETIQILSLISDCVFYFLPFILAYTCAKRFKTNEILALALAGAYLYPTILNGAAKGGSLHFLGMPIPLLTYSSTVFPIILSVLLLSYLYRFVERIMPKALTTVFTSLVVLLIMVPVQLIVLGPVGNYVGVILAQGVKWLFTLSPLLAGGILAALIPLMVFLGMHQAMGPIIIQSISTLGYDFMLPMFLVSEIAQTGATFGVFLRTKDKKMKAVSQSATVTGLLGITEPALYGCLIKYRQAFIAAMIGGGIGGAFAAAFGAKASAYSMPCLLTLPIFAGPALPFLIVGIVAAFVISAAIVWFLGLKETENETGTTAAADSDNLLTVFCPVAGELVPIQKVEDKTFSKEIIGKGIAVNPKDGTVVAPFDGVVLNTFDTKHALTLRSKQGVELLIHLGIDTIRLNGEGFTTKVKSGDSVKRGEPIATMNLQTISEKGYSPVTPVMVTNVEDYSKVEPVADGGCVEAGEPLLRLYH